MRAMPLSNLSNKLFSGPSPILMTGSMFRHAVCAWRATNRLSRSLRWVAAVTTQHGTPLPHGSSAQLGDQGRTSASA